MSITDFHNHLMPGVDDGATSDDEAAAALHAFLDQGVRNIVATPHVNASITLHRESLATRLAELEEGWIRLQRVAARVAPDAVIHRGAELMLDTPVPDLSDDRLRLAGTAFALCEYPYMTVPPNSTGVLRNIVDSGVTPVIAHPERYNGFMPDCRLASSWREAGALLQVNAGSLTGRYGDRARENVHALLEHGLADYMCSDFHSRGRPTTGAARRLLEEAGANEAFEMLAVINPARLLKGRPPLPVPGLRLRLGVRDRVRRWLR